MIWFYIIIGVIVVAFVVWFVAHQRKLRLRAHLMQEAIRNHDFTFRLPTHGLLSGERAMQETLNQLGETIRQQVSQNEVESWERLTRVLTHEMMNATAPMELEKPVLRPVDLRSVIDDVSRTYPQLSWEIHVLAGLNVSADVGMLRQVLMNLAKNALEADAKKMVVDVMDHDREDLSQHSQVVLYIGNDGQPIPAENRQSLFVPFFTTKRTGSGIGLSLSRRMMIQQGGMLDLADSPYSGCHTAFLLSLASL